MAEELDYYALLAVPQDADLATIRLAFRRLARLYHPDVAGTGSLERMQQLNAAYRVLSDPELRRTYDAQRPQPVPAPNQSSPAQPPTPPRPQTAKRTGTLRHSGGPFQYLHAFAAPDAIPVAALSFSGTGAVLGAGYWMGVSSFGICALPAASPCSALAARRMVASCKMCDSLPM